MHSSQNAVTGQYCCEQPHVQQLKGLGLLPAAPVLSLSVEASVAPALPQPMLISSNCCVQTAGLPPIKQHNSSSMDGFISSSPAMLVHQGCLLTIRTWVKQACRSTGSLTSNSSNSREDSYTSSLSSRRNKSNSRTRRGVC